MSLTISLTIEKAREILREKGFYRITHPVVLHHLRKEFQQYEVNKDYFYIYPVEQDFIHVALVEYDTPTNEVRLQIRYSCAGDDLLYGLRIKFTNGGSEDPQDDLVDILRWMNLESVRVHPHYIRKRFRHGRFQAKLRALLVYLKDRWRLLLPKRLPNE
jgi:hypothetical protein